MMLILGVDVHAAQSRAEDDRRAQWIKFCDSRIALEGARDVVIDPVRRATVLDLIDRVGPLCGKGVKKK